VDKNQNCSQNQPGFVQRKAVYTNASSVK